MNADPLSSVRTPSLFDPAPEPAPSHPCPTCAGSGRVSDDDLRRLVEARAGAVARNAPPTSRAAGRNPVNVVRFGTQRWQALRHLADHGPSTAAEVAVTLRRSRNQTATRLGELRDAGLVAYYRNEDGHRITRPTGPHDDGLVQAITMAGLAALRAAGLAHREKAR